ncbi:MAG TPA: glycoside hydrolase family 3 N-terminal domain-containing protein [Chloroflexota bacterium]
MSHDDRLLEQDVGQVLMVGVPGTTLTEEVTAFLAHCRVGGVCLFHENLANPWQAQRLTSALQGLARFRREPPLLLAADQEGGLVNRLGYPGAVLPSAMAIGATGSVAMARRCARVAARELRRLGLNVNFAPVADVNTNPANPVIGTRSYGSEPRRVAAMVAAAVAAHLDEGVLPVVKHFPGHGDTSHDSHHVLPAVGHDWARLWSCELAPFVAAFEAGAPLVCTAHVRYPALDPTGNPATLSAAVLGGLLRERLRFEGVVVSDALVMGAIASRASLVENALAALAAGVDLLLLLGSLDEQRAVYEALLAALRSGALPVRRVREAASRVLRLKQGLAPIATAPHPWPDPDHVAVCRAVARRGVTLIRDREGFLPVELSPTARLGLVELLPPLASPVETGGAEASAPGLLALLLRRHHPRVEAAVVAPDAPGQVAAARRLAERSDVVVVATRNALLSDGAARIVRETLGVGRPTIVAALRGPYDLLAFPDAPCYLAAYDDHVYAVEALVDVLFGSLRPRGRLPVDLPGLYRRGHGIARPSVGEREDIASTASPDR